MNLKVLEICSNTFLFDTSSQSRLKQGKIES